MSQRLVSSAKSRLSRPSLSASKATTCWHNDAWARRRLLTSDPCISPSLRSSSATCEDRDSHASDKATASRPEHAITAMTRTAAAHTATEKRGGPKVQNNELTTNIVPPPAGGSKLTLDPGAGLVTDSASPTIPAAAASSSAAGAGASVAGTAATAPDALCAAQQASHKL